MVMLKCNTGGHNFTLPLSLLLSLSRFLSPSLSLSQAEESTVQRNEQLLADLRKRSTTIAPLKLRRYPPTRSTTVESLCDWKTEKV